MRLGLGVSVISLVELLVDRASTTRGSSAPGAGTRGVKLADSCSIPPLVRLDEGLTFGEQVAHPLVLIEQPLVVQAKVQQSVLGLIHCYRRTTASIAATVICSLPEVRRG
jgi:hypothetical protein